MKLDKIVWAKPNIVLLAIPGGGGVKFVGDGGTIFIVPMAERL